MAVTAERYNIDVDRIVDFDTLNDTRTIAPIGVGKAVSGVSGNDFGTLIAGVRAMFCGFTFGSLLFLFFNNQIIHRAKNLYTQQTQLIDLNY